jgi:hypothetical protein
MCKFISYKNRHYVANNLTSYTDLYLNIVQKTPWVGIDCVFGKEFSFGGDLLKIEERFFILQFEDKGFFKTNPIYTKVVNGFNFYDYRLKFGQDKEWLDYIKWIATEINEEETLNEVIRQSQIVVDFLNQYNNESKF